MVVSQPKIILPIRAPYKTYKLQAGPCELKVDPYESNFGQYKAYAGVLDLWLSQNETQVSLGMSHAGQCMGQVG